MLRPFGKNTAMAGGNRMRGAPLAFSGGLWATNLIDVSTDPQCLERAGRWMVVLPFSGPATFLRFQTWSADPPEGLVGPFVGPDRGAWGSSCTRAEYVQAVQTVQEAIAAGSVYQANVCRVLRAPLPDVDRADVAGLAMLLAQGNPAPYLTMVRAPEIDLAIASASPELFLRRTGSQLLTGPIKGTAPTLDQMQEKDRAENVMIVDLMRNDLARVCEPGSIDVPHLLEPQEHPGLVHLVSTVGGDLRVGMGWPDILTATFPPGSVTGAPKIAALRIIKDIERAAREVYCGAIGWVDADSGEGSLAVAIRTFWVRADHLHFGTGAGITWSSDPHAEWRETELKADRLLDVASRSYDQS